MESTDGCIFGLSIVTEVYRESLCEDIESA